MSDETTAIELTRNDGALLNAFGSLIGNRNTGLGQSGRDKFLDTSINTIVLPLDRMELHALYRNSKICEKVVDLLPKAATSKTWLEITLGKGRKNIPAKALQYANDLKLRDAVREAAILGRLEGDGFIVMGIDDGQLPDVPVNEKNIRQISWLEVVTRYQLIPETNTGRPGKPEFYRLALPQNQGLGDGMTFGRIHRSRILRFPGKRLYGDMLSYNSHYHDSVLLAFWQSFIKYLTTIEYSVRMVQDYDTFAYSLKGLGELILRGKTEDILKRFQAILLSKSSLGGIAMDAEESASYVSRNFSGLDALIERMKDDTSASADMPPTKLWGSSQKSALSNSSEGDKYHWADCVEDYQAEAIDEPVTDFFRLSFLAQNGATGGRVPEGWSLKYKSVLQLNLKEQVELRAMQTKDVDVPSVQAGFLSQEEVRQAAWSGSEYSIERTLLSSELPQPQALAVGAGNTAMGEKLPTDKQLPSDKQTQVAANQVSKADAAEPLKIAGEVLSEDEYGAIAEINQPDIDAALKEWRSSAPDKFKGLLDGQP
jgi:hypothetical protein